MLAAPPGAVIAVGPPDVVPPAGRPGGAGSATDRPGAGRPGPQPIPLLAHRGLVDGSPAAYVCRNFACRAPVTDQAGLRAVLAATPPDPATE
jgi:hypothetical protein